MIRVDRPFAKFGDAFTPEQRERLAELVRREVERGFEAGKLRRVKRPRRPK